MNTSKPSCPSVAPRPRPEAFDYEDENEGRGRFGFQQRALPGAFTLIELLVVIAIIAILAALLFPAGVAVQAKATLKRVEGELAQVETAIESYKIDKGFYPPDNKTGNNPVTVQADRNSLYYELVGANINVTRDGFAPLDGSPAVSIAQLNSVFGVTGINNAGIADNTEGLVAKNYLPDIKPTQHGAEVGGLQVLGTVVDGPVALGAVNPFRYVSSNPTNNPASFDLWVDVLVRGKTNRISNWSDKPEIVSY
jgi:prepilin-type N-terminal cleavage/methylation domain-containing protein